jgi:hypothetical protein
MEGDDIAARIRTQAVTGDRYKHATTSTLYRKADKHAALARKGYCDPPASLP